MRRSLPAPVFSLSVISFSKFQQCAAEEIWSAHVIARNHDFLGVHICCMIFVKGERSFYAMRFLLGLAEAGFFPGVISI